MFNSLAIDAMISDTTVNHMLRAWKRARLSKDIAGLGLPSVNIIGKVMKFGPTIVSSIRGGLFLGTPEKSQDEQDAEIVQAIVDELADEHRVLLEAYYLGVIRGDVCRHWPHSARARVLGMARSTYFLRLSAARQQIAKNLVGRI